jgi:thiol:disulfide interchange protein
MPFFRSRDRRASAQIVVMKLLKSRLCVAWALASMLAGCEIGVEQPAAAPAAPARDSAAVNRARAWLRFSSDYAEASQRALREGKPLLLFFTAEWCHFCHQMADEAFSNPQVQSLSNHFVCVLVDADSEPALCEQFQITAFPTTQFMSSRGVPLERLVGKKAGHQLMIAMQAALQNVARRSLESESVRR